MKLKDLLKEDFGDKMFKLLKSGKILTLKDAEKNEFDVKWESLPLSHIIIKQNNKKQTPMMDDSKLKDWCENFSEKDLIKVK